MSDIVERIRSLRYVHVPVASELLEEAAGQIEKLRARLRLDDAAIRSDTPTLTDAEREAISYAAGALEHLPWYQQKLRDLLERTK